MCKLLTKYLAKYLCWLNSVQKSSNPKFVKIELETDAVKIVYPITPLTRPAALLLRQLKIISYIVWCFVCIQLIKCFGICRVLVYWVVECRFSSFFVDVDFPTIFGCRCRNNEFNFWTPYVPPLTQFGGGHLWQKLSADLCLWSHGEGVWTDEIIE